MGASELWRILVSLVGSGLAVAILMVAARMLRLDASRLPRRFVPPVMTLVMMVVAVTLILTLTRAPAESGAAVVVAEAGNAEEAPSRWSIRVYPFESWGEVPRREEYGTTFSRMILEEMRNGRNLNARRAFEHDLPLDLYDRDPVPRDLIRHYSKIAPFYAVTGFVSSRNGGRFEIAVDVSEINHSARSTTVYETTRTFTESKEYIDQVARAVASEISDMAEAAEN